MSVLVKVATFIWGITPSRSLREKYFAAYCWFVRNKRRIVNIDGINFALDFCQTIDVAVYLGRFEPEVTRAIRMHTRPGDIILDIGANAGVHALFFAKCAAPGGAVYAFEPTAFAFARLQTNAKLNPNLRIVPVKLALTDSNIESAEVDFRSSWRTDGVVDKSSQLVSFRRLDDWGREISLQRLDIIKLDVDGFEFQVLNGAAEVLARFRPLVIMEVGSYHFEAADRNPIAVLRSAGYSFWDAKTGAPLPPPAMQQHLASSEMAGITINVIASATIGFRP